MASITFISGGLSEAEKEFALNRADAKMAQSQLGSRIKNQGYNLKYVAEHTWAGGAATTDTHTVSGTGMTVETDDVIVVNQLDSVLQTAIKGVRASSTTITLTSVGNGADGEKVQILVYHKVKAES